ncbi:hypothetical protein ALC56_02999 [Trachymyrmex septentrionalis]|uniref:Uncharacterized protein n=1 Tax=Trachymyrmex septentrionalis TaxID=34720 RepID=A0A195FRX7_9HYME|nr:hypothetical protein ALC56_02999 [Trachymyrmex septentrionalis]
MMIQKYRRGKDPGYRQSSHGVTTAYRQESKNRSKERDAHLPSSSPVIVSTCCECLRIKPVSPAVTSFLNRGRLPPRLHYLATFHRHTASFTTVSSPPPPPAPLPPLPPPSSEALWQRSSFGHRYRFPPIGLWNSANGANPRFTQNHCYLQNYDPQYPE